MIRLVHKTLDELEVNEATLEPGILIPAGQDEIRMAPKQIPGTLSKPIWETNRDYWVPVRRFSFRLLKFPEEKVSLHAWVRLV
jgi:hypothetical protein